MTELDAPRPEAAPEVAPDSAPVTFGRRLAAERAKLGLSLADIASRLRLNPKQIAAIEAEELLALPAPFLRGFVRNYAKELHLDPAPLVAELNARLGPEVGGQHSVGASAGGSVRAAADHLSRPVAIGGVLAALAVFAVLGWLATRAERRAADTARQAVPTMPAPAQPAPEAKKPETPQPQTDVATPAAPGAISPPPAAQVAGAASAASPAAATPAATQSAEAVRLSFHDQSWVEVRQADGRVIHSQVNEAGTEQRIEGRTPLRLVIGNASAVSLDYKGKTIDLKPVTSPDNVARITLN